MPPPGREATGVSFWRDDSRRHLEPGVRLASGHPSGFHEDSGDANRSFGTHAEGSDRVAPGRVATMRVHSLPRHREPKAGRRIGDSGNARCYCATTQPHDAPRDPASQETRRAQARGRLEPRHRIRIWCACGRDHGEVTCDNERRSQTWMRPGDCEGQPGNGRQRKAWRSSCDISTGFGTSASTRPVWKILAEPTSGRALPPASWAVKNTSRHRPDTRGTGRCELRSEQGPERWLFKQRLDLSGWHSCRGGQLGPHAKCPEEAGGRCRTSMPRLDLSR